MPLSATPVSFYGRLAELGLLSFFLVRRQVSDLYVITPSMQWLFIFLLKVYSS